MSDLLTITRKTRQRLQMDEEVTPPHEEFVVQPNQQVRQAGATQAEDPFITAFRDRARRHLYVFVKSVLNRPYLTKELHLPLCQFIQRTPPRRKWVEVFREGGKSSIMIHGLPLHIHIQRAEDNCYFPGEDGREQRGILIGEAAGPISKHFSTLKEICEANGLLRALWPEHFWPEPPKQNWNASELTLPRQNPWPDNTFRMLGVGQAVTGAHPSWLGKDDLVTVAAMNSSTVMQSTIDWHVLSRAMINKPNTLEFGSGTRWGIWDLYSYIEDNDPSVEVYKQPLVVEVDGKEVITYPEFLGTDGVTYGHTWESIERLKKEYGSMYPLLYLLKADDPSLVDFHQDQLRAYTVQDGNVVFDEDGRDLKLAELKSLSRTNFPKATYPGQFLTPTLMQEILGRRHEHVRLH